MPQNPGTHLAEVCRQQQKSKRGEVQEQVMPAFNFTVFSISATESKIDPKTGKDAPGGLRLLVRKLVPLFPTELENLLNSAVVKRSTKPAEKQ